MAVSSRAASGGNSRWRACSTASPSARTSASISTCPRRRTPDLAPPGPGGNGSNRGRRLMLRKERSAPWLVAPASPVTAADRGATLLHSGVALVGIRGDGTGLGSVPDERL